MFASLIARRPLCRFVWVRLFRCAPLLASSLGALACGSSIGSESPTASDDEVPSFSPAPSPTPTPQPAPTPSPARPAPERMPPELPLDDGLDDPNVDEGDPGAPTGTIACAAWPPNTGTEQVSDTIEVSGTFDGGLKRFVGVGELGSGSQDESQPTFFALEDGAVLRNVILGFPAADGIHCEGSCTLENVWWEDVGEDAATFSAENASDVMSIQCAGARLAADKIFQHNGPGTVRIETFFAEDFGKVYRSCGNCREQFERHVEIRNLTARGGGTLAGINENFGDTASFENVSVDDDITVCERFRGNDTGAEPVSLGDGPDPEHCLYQSGDIHPL